VASHMVKIIWGTTLYGHTGNVVPIDITFQDETGTKTRGTATVTDLSGNPTEFRDVGKYIGTAVLPDGYVVDPDSQSEMTQELEIVAKMNVNSIWLALLIIIAIAIITIWALIKRNRGNAEA